MKSYVASTSWLFNAKLLLATTSTLSMTCFTEIQSLVKSGTFRQSSMSNCNCFAIFAVPVMVSPEKESYFAVEIRPKCH